MHLEDYHVSRSEEDVQRTISKSIKQEDFNTLHLAPITSVNTSNQQPCWITSHADNISSPVLPNNSSPKEYTDWDQLTTVFQYPCQPYSSTDRSPESTSNEATTPTWNNVIHNEISDCSNGQKLPSVGSAFSFSRTFCNTVYQNIKVIRIIRSIRMTYQYLCRLFFTIKPRIKDSMDPCKQLQMNLILV